MKEPVSEPRSQDQEVLATIGRRANFTPASQYWDTYSKLAPGHFKADDLILLQIRADLLREGICPQVTLSGVGRAKMLRYNDCFVHAWSKDAFVCMAFLQEYSKK